jgi:hypothetical protein
MNYLPYWNLDNVKKQQIVNHYLIKHNKRNIYYTFSNLWWDKFFNDFKKLNHPMPKYFDILKNLSEHNLKSYKSILPKIYWHLIPFYYYKVTNDPIPMWGVYIDKYIMELFSCIYVLLPVKPTQLAEMQINIENNYRLLWFFLKMIEDKSDKSDDNSYSSLYENYMSLDNISNMLYVNIGVIKTNFGWDNNFIIQKNNWKKTHSNILMELGMSEMMVTDIIEDIMNMYEYKILSLIKK